MAAVGSPPCTREPIGEGEQVSTFTLTDAAIERALAPDRYVAAPDDFTRQIAAAIEAKPRQSRLSFFIPAAWQRQMPLAVQMLLLLLLLGVLLIGAIAVASLQHTAAVNGNVIVADGAQLLEFDPTTGIRRSLLTGNNRIFGVTRSGDGRLISFWTQTSTVTALEVIDGTGRDRRRLATNVIPSPVGQGQIDVWSPDNKWLAAGVAVDGVQRILVVDIASGDGEIVGPIGATNPLWSPDGRLLAFSYTDGTRSVLAVMQPDGLGFRVVSGDLGGFDVSGANNWSPDGTWVYFGADRNDCRPACNLSMESHIYRARVAAGYSEQLTSHVLSMAPALSPDGTTVAYSDWPSGLGTQNLMLMDADGGNQRLLLASALNDGWSNDGEFLLTEWRPPGAKWELMVLRPDGTDRHTLMAFEFGCPSACAPNLGWGQPRP
jgi:TolB protein